MPLDVAPLNSTVCALGAGRQLLGVASTGRGDCRAGAGGRDHFKLLGGLWQPRHRSGVCPLYRRPFCCGHPLGGRRNLRMAGWYFAHFLLAASHVALAHLEQARTDVEACQAVLPVTSVEVPLRMPLKESAKMVEVRNRLCSPGFSSRIRTCPRTIKLRWFAARPTHFFRLHQRLNGAQGKVVAKWTFRATLEAGMTRSIVPIRDVIWVRFLPVTR